MTTRTVTATSAGEDLATFIASASFGEDQMTSVTGETRCHNGLEVDGVGAVGIPGRHQLSGSVSSADPASTST